MAGAARVRTSHRRAPERWLDGRAALVALALLAPAIALGLLAHRYPTFPLDRAALDAAQGLGSAYEPIAGLTNEFDLAIAAVALVGGASIMLWRGLLDGALLFPLAALARSGLPVFKEAVGRPRPSGDFPVRDVVDTSSFPSGHVMTAVVFAGLWFALAPQLVPARWVAPVRALAAVVVVLFAVSRMWAGVHWLSDTYGALVWGGLVVAAVLAVRPALRRACEAARRALRPA